jgi:hypothetical protein
VFDSIRFGSLVCLLIVCCCVFDLRTVFCLLNFIGMKLIGIRLLASYSLQPDSLYTTGTTRLLPPLLMVL